jgi:predicted RNA-binding protein with PIN domain
VYERGARCGSSRVGCRVSTGAPVPEPLLVPLIEAAADTLRSLDASDVPAALRQLQSFDRRGFLHGPAPRQVRRVLERDEGFREQVIERFGERPEVKGFVEEWRVDDAFTIAEAADARGDLALLASTLWAMQPAGYEYGLGVVHAQYERRRHDDAHTDDVQAHARERDAAEEARRRSDAARIAAEADRERVEQELREERRARRTREDEARADAAAATRTAQGLAAQLDQAQAALQSAGDRAAREARRAQELEDDVRALRSDLEAARAARPRPPPAYVPARTPAPDHARRLATELDTLSRRVADAVAQPTPATGGRAKAPRAPARRAVPDLPAGVIADTVTGAEAMLRTHGVTLVVDGYNVSKRAWPDATPSEQRERLALALAALHARSGCSSTLVFDGDSTATGTPVLRRRGLRVLFSAAGEEADDVVVREVQQLSKRVPVVVASSDAWVREHAEEEGAVVIGAETLLAALR